MPEYDRYDSGVRVKSAYRLYIDLHVYAKRRGTVSFSIVFCIQLLGVIDKLH